MNQNKCICMPFTKEAFEIFEDNNEQVQYELKNALLVFQVPGALLHSKWTDYFVRSALILI